MSANKSYQEKELLSRISNDDGEAFRMLLEQYHSVCYQVVINLIRDQFVAEDLVQEAFLKVWLNRKRLNEIENFGGWLRTISVHIVYHYIAKSRKDKGREEKWWQDMGLNLPIQPVSKEETLFQELIAQAIQRLPPKQRETFELVKKQGYSREEASQLLGVSTETIKTNLERAMKSIRVYCSDKLDGVSVLVIFGILY